jgi:hypothetical protein
MEVLKFNPTKAELELVASEDKKINEEKEAEHIAKNKEYNDWLEKHNVNLGDGSAIVNQFGNRFVLYKKVDEITIK